MTMYRFYRESTGQWENVSPERWQWEAHYIDGTVLKQFDDAGIFHQFREIDQSRLSYFSMVSSIVYCDSDNKSPIILQWNPGYKLIHFYTNYKMFPLGGTEQSFRIYCFGYECQHNKVIICIMPDDGIIITNDHNKINLE